MIGKTSIRQVVVFDYNWSGHIPSWHRLCVETALKAGYAVLSLSGSSNEVIRHAAEATPDLAKNLAAPDCPMLGQKPARSGIIANIRFLPGGYQLWSRVRRNTFLRKRHALQRWTACSQLLEKHSAELRGRPIVFFPYLDDMLEPGLTPADLRFAWDWCGALMTVSDLRMPRLAGGLRERLELAKHVGFRGVASLDATAMATLRTWLPPDSASALLPDIADVSLPSTASIDLVRNLKDRARGRKIVGLVGHLSEAKNLSLFQRIASNPAHCDLFFFMAGQYEPLSVAPRSRAWIEAAASGSFDNAWAIANRIPSESDFNLLLASCDLIFAVYKDFTRSSNILTKAAHFHKPVLVGSGYCMAERVDQYGLGLHVPENSLGEAEKAIRALLAQGPSNPRYAEYTSEFSLERFRLRLGDFLDACSTRVSAPR